MTIAKRTALVTGANKGIGFETARQLAQRGFSVWLGCRDETRGRAAAQALANDGDVRFVQLDTTEPSSVGAAAERIEHESGVLDVLVNNAGIAGDGDGFPSEARLEAVQRTFDVNFYGTLRVTQALLPLVKKAAAGRIVNVSSTWGSISVLQAPGSQLQSFPLFAYASSKTALNALTAWLAAELNGTPIKVSSVCPGYTATDMNHGAGALQPAEAAAIVVRASTLGAHEPTGTFFDSKGTLGW